MRVAATWVEIHSRDLLEVLRILIIVGIISIAMSSAKRRHLAARRKERNSQRRARNCVPFRIRSAKAMKKQACKRGRAVISSCANNGPWLHRRSHLPLWKRGLFTFMSFSVLMNYACAIFLGPLPCLLALPTLLGALHIMLASVMFSEA